MAETEPSLPEHWGKSLWCVYGPTSFPTMICFRIRCTDSYGPIIWGFSIYRRVPGFRTLGQRLETWREGKDAHFFETQDEALEYLKSLFAKVSKAK